MAWDVEGTDEFTAFWSSLVDRTHESSLHNLKELRPLSNAQHALRILFVFDPARTASLLLGGDKATNSGWNSWYRTAVPQAKRLYADYLIETSQGE